MFEAYKIGVTVAVTNMASAALGRVTKDFVGAQRSVQGLNKEIERLKNRTGAEGTLARQAALQRRIQSTAQASASSMAAQQATLAGQAAVLAEKMKEAAMPDTASLDRGLNKINRRRSEVERQFIKDKNSLQERAATLQNRQSIANQARANRAILRAQKDREFESQRQALSGIDDQLARTQAEAALQEKIDNERRRRIVQDRRSDEAERRTRQDRDNVRTRRSNLDAVRVSKLDALDEQEESLRERHGRAERRRKMDQLRLQEQAVKLDGQRQVLESRIQEAKLRGDNAAARALDIERQRVHEASRLAKAEAEIIAAQRKQELLLKRQRTLRRGLMASAGLIAGGALPLWALSKTVGPAKDVRREEMMLRIAGVDATERAAAKSFWAQKLTQEVPTAGLAESLATYLQSRQIFGDEGLAKAAMPQMMKTASVLMASTGQELDISRMVMALGKVVDMRGKSLRPEDFQKEVEMMSKAIIWSGGVITPDTYQGVLKYARTAKMTIAPEVLYEALPTLIMENMTKGGGGSGRGGVGAPLATLYNVMQGSIEKKRYGLLMEMGLLTEDRLTEDGRIDPAKGLVGSQEGARNPIKWINETLRTAMESYVATKGIEIEGKNVKIDVEKLKETEAGRDKLGHIMLDVIRMLFSGSRRTASFVGSVVYGKQAMDRDIAMIRKAMTGTVAYNALLKDDPGTIERAAGAQFTSLRAQLGEAFLPFYNQVLGQLVVLMADWNKALEKNPELVGKVVQGIALTSTAMVGLGTLLAVNTVRKAGAATAAIMNLNWQLGKLAAAAGVATTGGAGGAAAAGAAGGGLFAGLGLAGFKASVAANWKAFTSGAGLRAASGLVSPLPLDFIFGEMNDAVSLAFARRDFARGQLPHQAVPFSPLGLDADRKEQIHIYLDGQELESVVTARQLTTLDWGTQGARFDGTGLYPLPDTETR